MQDHSIYKTTNLVNGKYYWGVHNSTNENDGYLGSGKALNNAIKKYGKENFVRKTMVTYETSEAAYFEEKLIVNQEMINDSMCYNIKVGGDGGWDHIKNAGELHSKWKEKVLLNCLECGNGYKVKPCIKETSKFCSIKCKNIYQSKNITGENHPNYGKKNPEHSIRMSGKNNPMYGRGYLFLGQNNPNSKTNREKRKI